MEAVQSFKGDMVARAKFYGSEERYDLHKFEPCVPSSGAEGTIAALPRFAGEGVSRLHKS